MKYHFDIRGDDFSIAGNASTQIKKQLKNLHLPPAVIKRVAIAMYEAELNMVVHADGGTIDVDIDNDKIIIIVSDNGPGISDIDKAMIEGFSTANNVYVELGYGAGMGLSNIKKNTDLLSIESVAQKGTTLTMTILYDN